MPETGRYCDCAGPPSNNTSIVGTTCGCIIAVQCDLLITNRLIRQSLVGLTYFGKSDPERGVA